MERRHQTLAEHLNDVFNWFHASATDPIKRLNANLTEYSACSTLKPALQTSSQPGQGIPKMGQPFIFWLLVIELSH
jgi:hypothetical protein